MTTRSLLERLWYEYIRFTFRIIAISLYRIRARNVHHVPESGGAIILSNHQSHFDPAVIGLICNRRLNFLARESLFRFAPFRLFISSLNAIPVDREGSALSGLKETLKRLKHGEIIVIFPEGTRTSDGEVASLKPGFSALARRAKVPLVPVAIDGAYQAWSRWHSWPRSGIVHVEFGPPLTPDEISKLSDEQLLAEMGERIRACHRLAAASRRRVLGGQAAIA